ncbi:hypothetical protein SteCoe_19680 [Stentor coeruleus]|uniref:Uncharacterized protein n=1 Tax=Stentor coeruleus TaxID=5963 RepID=A0A1R2BTZ0_9CILI|nr:hypothetical protein SteCoe_19680 [Stentor coeruleus]
MHRDASTRLQKLIEKTQAMKKYLPHSQARCIEVFQKFHYKSISPHPQFCQSLPSEDKMPNILLKQNFPTQLVPLEEQTKNDLPDLPNLHKCLSDKIINKKTRAGSVRQIKTPRKKCKNPEIESPKLIFFEYESGAKYKAETRYKQNESKESILS